MSTQVLKIAVIIPTYNESDNIYRLVRFLRLGLSDIPGEIIVSDGGSEDNTRQEAELAGAKVLESPKKGRAQQMNFAANHSEADILYFLHADIVPPQCFARDIIGAVNGGAAIGRYKMWFDSDRPGLKLNSFFSQFNLLWCSGGDQSIFITRRFWDLLGGYDPAFTIMEEYDLLRRARKLEKIHILNGWVRTTDRKYQDNGYFKVNLANLKAFLMWRLGYPPQRIYRYYKEQLNWR